MVTNSTQKIQPQLNGVLVVNKPAGITSHDVIYKLRRITGMQRIGHTGTLDPFATGVLLVALGKATRLVEYSHVFSKTYVTEATLGAISTTDDLTGEVTEHEISTPPSLEEIEQALTKFIGLVKQKPPHYSAIKIRGKKLYKYARSETPIDLPLRSVRIYSITLQEYTFPHIQFSVTCGSGTYIRSLIRDLGVILKMGAYTSQLHRSSIGQFSDHEAHTLDTLTLPQIETSLYPLDSLVSHLPKLTLSKNEYTDIVQGKTISGHNRLSQLTPFRMYTEDEKFIGIGRLDNDQVKPVKIFI